MLVFYSDVFARRICQNIIHMSGGDVSINFEQEQSVSTIFYFPFSVSCMRCVRRTSTQNILNGNARQRQAGRAERTDVFLCQNINIECIVCVCVSEVMRSNFIVVASNICVDSYKMRDREAQTHFEYPSCFQKLLHLQHHLDIYIRLDHHLCFRNSFSNITE